MSIQALIFDVDGTIAETADIHRAAFNQSFRARGLGWVWDRKIFSLLTGQLTDLQKLQTYNRTVAKLDSTPRLSLDDLRQIQADKTRRFVRLVKGSHVALRPGVARLIFEARHENMVIGALATGPRAEFDALMLHLFGYDALAMFDCIRTREDMGKPEKLNPLYRSVIDCIGVEPGRIMAFDDCEFGVLSAKLAGMRAIATPSLYTSSQMFKAADLVISDLGEPAAPFELIRGKQGISDFISPQFLNGLDNGRFKAA